MDELLNAAPCGFLCCADDGTILQANATICGWLGHEAGDLVGRPIASILSMGGRIFHQTHIFPLLKLKGQADEIYFSLKCREGEALPVLTNAARREREGTFSSDYVFLPMRQRREYEDELLQAKKVAEGASQAKARFLSMMSHELRTPMNAILGFGQLLQLEELDHLQTESVQHIVSAGQHLLSLINEVLDLSRIEAGHLAVASEPVLASDAMRGAFEMARPLTLKRSIQMQMPPGPDDKYFVRADRGRLRQILLNLLANAIKYNRKAGSVFLTCERRCVAPDGSDESVEWLRFVVRDTGPGIAARNQSKLFVPFERLGAERGEVEGTGLGLALCQRLAEAMGGQIGVQSTEGEGSSFWVEFPVAPAPAQAQQSLDEELAVAETPSATALVLYIEDNASNMTLMKRILARRPSTRLLPAVTGEAGLQLARAHCPSLILLDLQLPDIGGDMVLKYLREDESTRHIPVVVLSADATPEQAKRLLKAGARDYLTKPIEVQKLLQLLDDLLENPAAG